MLTDLESDFVTLSSLLANASISETEYNVYVLRSCKQSVQQHPNQLHHSTELHYTNTHTHKCQRSQILVRNLYANSIMMHE